MHAQGTIWMGGILISGVYSGAATGSLSAKPPGATSARHHCDCKSDLMGRGLGPEIERPATGGPVASKQGLGT